MWTSLGTAPEKMVLRSRTLSFFLRCPSINDIAAFTLARYHSLTSSPPHLLRAPRVTVVALALPQVPYCHRGISQHPILLDFCRAFGGIDNNFWKDTPFSGVDFLPFPLSLNLLDFQAPPFHVHPTRLSPGLPNLSQDRKIGGTWQIFKSNCHLLRKSM